MVQPLGPMEIRQQIAYEANAESQKNPPLSSADILGNAHTAKQPLRTKNNASASQPAAAPSSSQAAQTAEAAKAAYMGRMTSPLDFTPLTNKEEEAINKWKAAKAADREARAAAKAARTGNKTSSSPPQRFRVEKNGVNKNVYYVTPESGTPRPPTGALSSIEAQSQSGAPLQSGGKKSRKSKRSHRSRKKSHKKSKKSHKKSRKSHKGR